MSATILPTARRATIDDLLRYDGKAELINGKMVTYMPAGIRNSRIATMICVVLLQFEKATKLGYAFDDNLGYRVAELFSGRDSFSPDVSFFVGQLSLKDKGFVDGPPTFAVEIRSPEEYGSAAEKTLAASVRIILKQARWWCGMLIRRPRRSAVIDLMHRRRRWCFS